MIRFFGVIGLSVLLMSFAACGVMQKPMGASKPPAPKAAKKKKPPADLPRPPKAEPAFEALKAQINQFDNPNDFKALRMAYTRTAAYRPSSVPDEMEKAMFDALNGGDYQKALDLALYRLDENYVDINAHHVASVAYWELRDRERASFHKFVKYGLIDSILTSGDGKTPQSAYVVIDAAEEYAVLDVLGYKRNGGQADIVKNGHQYDELQVTSRKTGESTILYFNIDIPRKRLTGRF